MKNFTNLVNESNVSIEIGKALTNIKPEEFTKKVSEDKMDLEKQCEYLYNTYLKEFSPSDILPIVNKDKNITGTLQKLGGFMLMYAFAIWIKNKSEE